MKIILDISGTIASYENTLALLKARFEKLPKDRICAHKRNERYIYCLRTRDMQGKVHEEYLKANRNELIRGCSEAAYLRNLILAIEKELKALKAFENGYKPNEKYDAWEKLPPAYKRYANRVFSDNETICREWEFADFKRSSYPIANENQYVTKKSEVVRSRIELIVANILYDLAIPYRYECRLDLPAGVIYPDFTIMHPVTLELYYVEIFGMMDNPEYEQAAFSKISKYAASDCYKNLLMFFDHKNAPISPTSIRNVFKDIFIND